MANVTPISLRWAAAMAMAALCCVARPSAAADEIEGVAYRPAAAPCRPRCESCTPVAPEDGSANITPAPGEQPDISSQIANDFGSASGPDTAAPNMLGDFLGTANGNVVLLDAFGNSVVLQNVLSPYFRQNFKIGENQGARPQDRLFTDFHYFQARTINVARYAAGFEKTFLEGDASFGMRMPYFSVNPDPLPGTGNTVGAFGLSPSSQSDVGDLTTFFKYAPYLDGITGETLTLGLAVTAPTGPETLGGVTPLFTTTAKHNGSIQPFFGFLFPSATGWFAQGFTSVDIPFSDGDTTWWFNDLSVGRYFDRGPQFIVTALIPLLELHVNTPVDGRIIQVTGATPAAGALFRNSGPSAFFARGQFEVHNQVNLNTAITFELNRRSTLALGLVTPVEGPRPFNTELQVQFNTFGIGSGPRFRE